MKKLQIVFLIFVILLFTGCGGKEIPILIKSTPQNADIYESHFGHLGKTDKGIVLKVDDNVRYLNISVKKDGYEEAKEIIDLQNQRTKLIDLDSLSNEVASLLDLEFLKNSESYLIDFILTKKITTLSVNTYPKNAKVVLNCDNTIFNAHNEIEIPNSIFGDKSSITCNLSIKENGFEELSEVIVLKKYKKHSLSKVLKELKSHINFDSTPKGVDVYEKHLGYIGTTPFKTQISSEKLSQISTTRDEINEKETKLNLIFKKSGYEELEKSIWFNKSKNLNIDVQLKRKD